MFKKKKTKEEPYYFKIILDAIEKRELYAYVPIKNPEKEKDFIQFVQTNSYNYEKSYILNGTLYYKVWGWRLT